MIIAIVLPENRNPGILLIYLTISVLSKIGLPVFLNPHSGWGWSTPNLIGWSLGGLFWIIVYLGVACITAKVIDKSKGKLKDKNIKT